MSLPVSSCTNSTKNQIKKMNATYIGFGLYTIIGFDDAVCPGTNTGKKFTIFFSRNILDGSFVSSAFMLFRKLF